MASLNMKPMEANEQPEMSKSDAFPKRPEDRREFKIGIICAMGLEANMVEKVFDKDYWTDEHKRYKTAHGDPNSYSTGVIAGHNVVLAHCNRMGSNRAAQVATGLRSSFSGIKIVLVVGICGAVPFIEKNGETEEVVLGDLMVSTGIVQFDLQRQGPAGTQRKDESEGLSKVSPETLSLLGSLETEKGRARLTNRLVSHLQALQEKNSKRLIYPGYDQDRLFHSNFIHTHQSSIKDCRDCNTQLGICAKPCEELGCYRKGKNLKSRTRLNSDATPRIHFGCFGSSNTVLKSGEQRDKLAKIDKIVAFEMEGSGVRDIYPTIIIKAVCDYADSHKNDLWQPYAAAVAAAGLKGFLEELQFPDEEGPSQDMITRMITDVRTSVADLVTRPSKTTRWPLIILPFRRDSKFVGRKEILTAMFQKVQDRTPSYQLRLALVGMGGVGKSQIAIEFAYQLLQQQRDCSVFWIYAANEERFKQSFREIADEAGLQFREETGPLDVVHQWLSQQKGKWVMILDNLDEEKTLTEIRANGKAFRDYLPTTDTGLIIMTTRSRTVAITFAEADNTLSIGPMNEEESMQLLSGRTTVDSQTTAKAKELLRELEWLPLAITHAGTYISIHAPRWTISKYLEVLNTEKQRIELLNKTEIFDDRRDSSTARTVMATWHVSFKSVKERNPAAADLLFVMSMFDSQDILEELLRTTTDTDLEFDSNINVLLDYSLIVTGNRQSSFNMHRLVQMAVILWLEGNGEMRSWWKVSLSAFLRVFPEDPIDATQFTTCSRLIPHGSNIFRLGAPASEEEATKDIAMGDLELAGKLLGFLNLVDGTVLGEELCEQSFELSQSFLGDSHKTTLVFGGILTSKWLDSLQLNRAETHQRLLVEMSASRRKDKIYIKIRGHLIVMLICVQKYEEAELLARSLLEDLKDPEEDFLPEVEGLNNLLKYALSFQGNLHNQDLNVEAEEEFHPELESSIGTFGSKLISVFFWLHHYIKWIVKYSEYVPDKIKVVGDIFDDVPSENGLGAICIMNIRFDLAELFFVKERYIEAEITARKALEARIRVFGDDHPLTLNSKKQHAIFCMAANAEKLEDKGKWIEAEPLHCEILASIPDQQPEDLSNIYHRIALLSRNLGEQGDIVKAEPIMVKARLTAYKLGAKLVVERKRDLGGLMSKFEGLWIHKPPRIMFATATALLKESNELIRREDYGQAQMLLTFAMALSREIPDAQEVQLRSGAPDPVPSFPQLFGLVLQLMVKPLELQGEYDQTESWNEAITEIFKDRGAERRLVTNEMMQLWGLAGSGLQTPFQQRYYTKDSDVD